MAVKVIGIDVATDPRKIGLSLGEYGNGNIKLIESELGSTTKQTIAGRIQAWIKEDDLVLIGMDAPLGWPKLLGENLNSHQAGDSLIGTAHSMFRRTTDEFVKEKIGKQPLDVGADRIARTAHKALSIIEELRALTSQKIPLCFSYDDIESSNGIFLLEVYPAATLKSYHMKNTGYKDKKKSEERTLILEELKRHIIIEIDTSLLIQNADVLDSAVCLLSVKDFIEGNCYMPKDRSLAKKEGWIWVKKW